MSIVNDRPSAIVLGAAQHVTAQARAADSTVLITENEVLFATATAKGLPRENQRWAMFRRIVVALALSRSDEAVQDDSGPRYNHHPRRRAYLDDSRMAREMLRL
ncbi:MAG: hypothetical protein ACM4D3_22010 [Candidatus Sericytochromatia bacterium]